MNAKTLFLFVLFISFAALGCDEELPECECDWGVVCKEGGDTLAQDTLTAVDTITEDGVLVDSFSSDSVMDDSSSEDTVEGDEDSDTEDVEYDIPSDGTCTPPSEACGGKCIDTSTDIVNCGACGQPCTENSVCLDGECQCADGYDKCRLMCVDYSSDPDHCGDCGISCPLEAYCGEGACICPDDKAHCVGSDLVPICVDLDTDLNHCGDCGNLCAADFRNAECIGGECICKDGAEFCEGQCVDLLTDMEHCGECGNVCNGLCENGTCACDPALCVAPNVASAICLGNECRVEQCEEGSLLCPPLGSFEDGCPYCGTSCSSKTVCADDEVCSAEGVCVPE